MKKIIKYLLMWSIVLLITLSFLKLAIETQMGAWIKVAWATSFWFGVQTILLFQILDEWKEERKKNKKPRWCRMMDEGYKNWFEERDRKIRKDAIIVGSILYVSMLVVVFLIF